MTNLSSIEEALTAFRAGEFVIVVDDEDRENEGDLILAAEHMTEEKMAFMIRHTGGVVCMPISNYIADQLDLPHMVTQNTSTYSTPFTVSVEAATGVTTGISAHDRARTVQAIIHPVAQPADVHRPGHIFPLRAADGGVLVRAGHTEASIDLCKLCGKREGAVLSELMHDNGTMMRLPDLKIFAKKHAMSIISIADLIAYRRRTETFVRREYTKSYTNKFGIWNMYVYKDVLHACEHVALVKGSIDAIAPTLVRVHSEELTDDVFGSHQSIDTAMQMIEAQGVGVFLYLRHQCKHESLVSQLQPQQKSSKSEEAEVKEYGIGAQILKDLEVGNFCLISNSSRKLVGLDGYGLHIVDQIPLKIVQKIRNQKPKL